MTAAQIFSTLLGVGLAGFALRAAVRSAARERSRARLAPEGLEARGGSHVASAAGAPAAGPASRWLSRAGFDAPDAFLRYVGASVGILAAGVFLALVLERSGLFARVGLRLEAVPGIGAGLAPIAALGPWLLVGSCALAPVAWVSRARRLRLESVEVELPVTLEILATLAESGLGFDACLAEVLGAQTARRRRGAFVDALALVQAEQRAGIARGESLRRLADRLDHPAVSSFASALAQAEELGSSIGFVLRRQAEDVRARRRERALARAEALPVKLVVPAAICFLPALFAWALGPSFHQIWQTLARMGMGG